MKISSWYLAILFTLGNAERDSNYYGSFSNPNLSYDHYWSSSKHVLEDLSLFDKLYVQFENCAWSTAKYTADDFDDDDGDDRRRLEENQCGDGGGDEDNWWVGMSECKQSNVAYSLYGILIDETEHQLSIYDMFSGKSIKRRSPCSKHTYINSFFTLDGLHSFVKATQKKVDVSTAVPYCSYYYDGDDDGSGDRQRMLSDSGDGDSLYYTTGCSTSGNFTVDTFMSATCNGNYFNETLYQLEQLNNDFQNLQCEQIYDSDGSIDYASTLLYYSDTCSISGIHKDFCPDPYGVLANYEYNFAMSQSNSSFLASPYDEKNGEANFWLLPINEVLASCLFIAFGTYITKKGMEKRKLVEIEDEDPDKEMEPNNDAVYA